MNNRKMSRVHHAESCPELVRSLLPIIYHHYQFLSYPNAAHTDNFTIETGSVTAVVVLLNFVLFIVFLHQTPYVTPGLLVPKLYANFVYMALNSRFKIIGELNTYESSVDMSITAMMIRDIVSQSIDDTQPIHSRCQLAYYRAKHSMIFLKRAKSMIDHATAI
ncbi:hypothetical protein IW261DRAFT_860365 [Armillaria novae-zelandiae]|uniref:Uncharacterized protein n=1 Tax=Armillaria novae-zelandiae TaxID=153914 RepID=A0AA39PIE3_9AGAR|nr:hypothetical protein IW261DRAFT_860365 [Armillaria novae-zelandiae]